MKEGMIQPIHKGSCFTPADVSTLSRMIPNVDHARKSKLRGAVGWGGGNGRE
jgi:hypothetical protein